MPKMKTHSATKKRVKRTASGKVKVPHSNRNHLKSAKSKSAIRRNRNDNFIDKSDMKRIKKQIAPIK